MQNLRKLRRGGHYKFEIKKGLFKAADSARGEEGQR